MTNGMHPGIVERSNVAGWSTWRSQSVAGVAGKFDAGPTPMSFITPNIKG